MGIKNKIELSDLQLIEVARLCKALAEPSRLKLLRALMESSMTVSELMEATGMRQGNVSKHLGLLLSHGLVRRIPEGNFARYVIVDHSVSDLCHLLCSCAEAHAREKLRSLV